MKIDGEMRLGTVMRHAPAREVMQREFPGLPTSPYVEMLRMLTLGSLAGWLLDDSFELDRLAEALASVPEPATYDLPPFEPDDAADTMIDGGTSSMTAPSSAPRWGVYEVQLSGPSAGNPYVDVRLSAEFVHADSRVTVHGFHDGGDSYRIRFMPEHEGEWTFSVSSNAHALNGATGSFMCTAAVAGSHGPVRVVEGFHFAHADGTRFHPFGTTVYGLCHQSEALEQLTLATLERSPFNKVRMCAFPKWYPFNTFEPLRHAFEQRPDGTFDLVRFVPEFFSHLERRILDLAALGIEVDLILFHPYDKWGYSDMPAVIDDHYLRYMVARLGAFANVWWSLANEFDFMYDKRDDGWRRFGDIINTRDPHGHLIGVHNGSRIWDHSLEWVSHASLQGTEPWRTTENVLDWRREWGKPVVVDECGYEGDIEFGFGNLTAEEMTRRFWEGVCRGGYVTHGECFLDPDDVLWWGRGGVLHGASTPRLAFLRSVLESAPGAPEPVETRRGFATIGVRDQWFLTYNSGRQPRRRTLETPAGRRYSVEMLDTWNMTVTDLGEYQSGDEVHLPMQPYLALRLTAV